MRRVIALEFMTLDGVIQGPGGPDEDASGGFTHGGWIRGYSDPVLDATVREQMDLPFDLLIGRVTFDIWAPYWPAHAEIWPGVMSATKYVASTTLTAHDWQPTVFLDDAVSQVTALKEQGGPDLHVFGSGNLLQSLLTHDLVDELWLRIFPLTLGTGKRLFEGGTVPSRFEMVDGTVTPSGVIVANYARTTANRGDG